ncbi:Pyocin activator protein PrtN [Bradyrhizobium macuxiense]|uniref:Pyocin activator protein PrtN n=1 Tax=Bradyrhizobium macuxiense TaxID=1755647 RepID=A0A109K4Z9_9BRAD|nr:Pyocin activator protein PrtN [Bradyrhizobium macuxiense]
MNTAFLLMAQYNGKAVIPLADVQRDYFSHLDVVHMLRKINDGDIRLPVVRIEDNQKSAKGIHLQDLADYLDERRAAAKKELKQVWG